MFMRSANMRRNHIYITSHFIMKFLFDPVSVSLKNLGELGIPSLEQNHENIEASEETQRRLTSPHDTHERAVSCEFGLVLHTFVPMGAEDTRVAERNDDLSLHIYYNEITILDYHRLTNFSLKKRRRALRFFSSRPATRA